MTASPAVLGRAAFLAEAARTEKHAVAQHRRALREKTAELRRFCEANGIAFEEIKDGEVASWSKQQIANRS